ncbi:MAG: extracellular solute-binding protein [Spirochaetes bacterium]|nr:extracellular solute-binding protein [Spirochaetota bacterium]
MNKKIFAVVLIAFILMFAMLITISAKKTTSNVIKICVSDAWWGTSRDPDLQNAVIKELEKKIGIKIKPIIPTNAQYKEKVGLLLNSGDKPDIFRAFQAMNFVPSYAVQGHIIPLDDYIKKSPLASSVDPKIYDLLKVNGKIYFIPFNKPATKNLWMRKDLADKYGIKLSSTPTTDEFFTEMKKVVSADKKIIAFCFPKFIDNFQFFYNSFGCYANIYPKDGKYIDGFNTPEAKETLVYIKKLYDEGIWDKEFITNENNKMRENLFKGMAVSDIDYYYRYSFYVDNSVNAKAETDFLPLYKLVGPKGFGGNLNEAIQDAWVITNTCKNPDVAFKFIEQEVFNPEVRQITSIGVKSLHYSVDEKGIAQPRDVAKATGYNLNPQFLFASFPDFSDKGFQWSPQVLKSLPKQIQIAKEQAKHLGPAFAAPAGKSEKYDQVVLSIKKKREEIASKFVLGSATLEEAFKEYDNYWKSIDGAKMLDELNR